MELPYSFIQGIRFVFSFLLTEMFTINKAIYSTSTKERINTAYKCIYINICMIFVMFV